MTQNTIGQGEIQMFIGVGGNQYEVVTAKQAGIEMGYSQEYLCRLCDEGSLIAHKVAGVWWIQTWQFRNGSTN